MEPVEKSGKTVEKLEIFVEIVGNLWGKSLKKNKNCKFLQTRPDENFFNSLFV
jgi:hypothetical protein